MKTEVRVVGPQHKDTRAVAEQSSELLQGAWLALPACRTVSQFLLHQDTKFV